MKILHYALGFPPYRTGGLTKFCMDVMAQQRKLGHEVALLWPGQMKWNNDRVEVRNGKDREGIKSYEVINPLPVPYDEGITEISAFMARCTESVYTDFLREYQPDVIHVHTLMGLHAEILTAAKKLKIRTVFSVHDFFPICPKVTMHREGSVCQSAENCTACPQCNLTALSINKIRILQSPMYRTLKDSAVVKKLRKNHRDQYLSGQMGTEAEAAAFSARTPEDYLKLRHYYGSMIASFDMVHYNSTLTKCVFERFFQPPKSVVIPISHASIKDNRKIKNFGSKLRLTYLGPQGQAKGYFLLKEALDEWWKSKQTFTLNVFFTPMEVPPYMKIHDRYSYKDLERIFNETDVLVAPSVWNETFGYTVLEALSYGVPVVISGNVGAKDIVSDGFGVVVEEMNKDNLLKGLQTLTSKTLSAMNQNIVRNFNVVTLQKVVDDITEKCYGTDNI